MKTTYLARVVEKIVYLGALGIIVLIPLDSFLQLYYGNNTVVEQIFGWLVPVWIVITVVYLLFPHREHPHH